MLRGASADVLWLLAQSAVLLPLTRLILFIAPFHALVRLFGRLARASIGRGPSNAAAIRRVEWAVTRASSLIPGTRHCLTQALVAQLLLARRGQLARLCIGVAKDARGGLKGHAWVESDGSAVFGVPDSGLDEFRRLPHLDRA